MVLSLTSKLVQLLRCQNPVGKQAAMAMPLYIGRQRNLVGVQRSPGTRSPTTERHQQPEAELGDCGRRQRAKSKVRSRAVLNHPDFGTRSSAFVWWTCCSCAHTGFWHWRPPTSLERTLRLGVRARESVRWHCCPSSGSLDTSTRAAKLYHHTQRTAPTCSTSAHTPSGVLGRRESKVTVCNSSPLPQASRLAPDPPTHLGA